MEVWQSANETIVENENTLELQAIGILIAILYSDWKCEF